MRVEDWEGSVGRVAFDGSRTTTCAGVPYAVSANRVTWPAAQGGRLAVHVVVNAMAGWKVFELVVDGKVIEATNDTSTVRNQRVRDAMETALGCAMGAAREWVPAARAATVAARRAATPPEEPVAGAGATPSPADAESGSGTEGDAGTSNLSPEDAAEAEVAAVLEAGNEADEAEPDAGRPVAMTAIPRKRPAHRTHRTRHPVVPAEADPGATTDEDPATTKDDETRATRDGDPGPTTDDRPGLTQGADAASPAVLPEPIPFRPRPSRRRTPPQNGTH